MTSTFACDLTVFTPPQRGRLRTLVLEVFAACRDVEEMADGYRLTGRPGIKPFLLAEFKDQLATKLVR